ncbi:TPA: hypothetical protein I8608_002206 [Morganella morganii]|uniref:Uncharacterized protein n=1 Tax=Morganella morganii TaxID=582 RepID=A0AAN5S082_MORMO|nr:hypothetical protein [Morganella morganii]HDU8642191.1 hypothetical protein [Morganella morganii subsp. morganii]
MWWVIGFFLLLILFPVVLKILPPIIFKKLNNYTLLLNTNSLHSQYLFQVVILLPLILSLYLMVWIGSEYPFRLDSIGFNFFLNIQKLPLGILALSPILGAFIVYAHRSLQTEKQIKTAENQLEEAQRKNKVDIYYATRKFIYDQLSSVKTINDEVITNPTSLYLKAYKQNGDFTDKKINTIYDELNEILNSQVLTNNQIKEMNSWDIFNILNGDSIGITKESDLKSYVISLDITLSSIKKTLSIDNLNATLLYEKHINSMTEIKKIWKYMSKYTLDSDEYIFSHRDINVKYYLFIVELAKNIYSTLQTTHEVIAILNPSEDIDKSMPLLKTRREDIEAFYSTLTKMEYD